MRVRVIGGGLAGPEAALQAARRGCEVELHEMRPAKTTDGPKPIPHRCRPRGSKGCPIIVAATLHTNYPTHAMAVRRRNR